MSKSGNDIAENLSLDFPTFGDGWLDRISIVPFEETLYNIGEKLDDRTAEKPNLISKIERKWNWTYHGSVLKCSEKGWEFTRRKLRQKAAKNCQVVYS